MSARAAGLPVLVRVWLISLAALAVICLPNLADPMIRFDDFPALLADPSGFWAKTLHEGRWVNYLWHLRGVVTPSWLNFAIYQALWALVASCFAVSLLDRFGGRSEAIGPAVLTALFILIAPPATLISLWFNTLLPGLALVALYAWLGTQASPRALRALMPVFVVLSFMAYTTYPLLILLVCLLNTERHSLRDLIAVLALFSVSFVAAVLLVYTLNYAVHGVFGVPLADWRAATPASDLSGVMANVPLVWQSFVRLGEIASFKFAPLLWIHCALFAVSTGILLRARRDVALYLLAGLALGLALIIVQVLKMGVAVPPRGFIFVWVIYALMAGGALQTVSGRTLRWMRNAVLLVIGTYALMTGARYYAFTEWQSETRALAAHVTGDLRIAPEVMDSTSAESASIQHPMALSFRLQYLTGLKTEVCTQCQANVTRDETGALRFIPD